ncbi:thiol-disulfide oxidoreductase DCC [Trifolium pratense]|uniref:Thiol-disulfide oxidoreductase DCC n=1 Tax=Trifolium pratense TaxID=57577 RepID=A0A2K3NGB5_TRIPR|nr:thiol-disulfide oxidoreductase DCC [Trifolium pratense]
MNEARTQTHESGFFTHKPSTFISNNFNHNKVMALRIAAASTSRIAKPYNPSPLFSASFQNLNLKFNLPPRLPQANAFSPIRKPGSQCYIRAISDAAVESTISKKQEEEEQSPKDWKIKMLYDGDCPLCMREVNMLRERNKSYGTIKFVDIGSDDYSPQENQGLDYQTAMGRIHAILSDGTVVTDVEAFRRLYEEVGLGWVYAVTKYEPLIHATDASVY